MKQLIVIDFFYVFSLSMVLFLVLLIIANKIFPVRQLIAD